MQSSTFKTSTIFVATRKKTRVYHSIEDVPAPLRKRMTDNLAGPNTRTLIVADRRGREYLLKALQRATGTNPLRRTRAVEDIYSRDWRLAWGKAQRYWLEIALIGLLGMAGWALFATK